MHIADGAMPLGLKSDLSLNPSYLRLAARVDQYDISFVTAKLVEDGKLQQDDVPAVSREFKRFIVLAGLGVKPLAMISPLVDEVWHQFILFTDQYRRFCRITVGRFIGHQPDTPSTPIPVVAGRNFLHGYAKYFGPVPSVWFKGMNRNTVRFYLRGAIDGRPPTRWSGWTG